MPWLVQCQAEQASAETIGSNELEIYANSCTPKCVGYTVRHCNGHANIDSSIFLNCRYLYAVQTKGYTKYMQIYPKFQEFRI